MSNIENTEPDDTESEQSDYVHECRWCDGVHPESEMNKVYGPVRYRQQRDEYYLCDLCHDNSFICYNCEGIEHYEEGVSYRGDTWCDRCACDNLSYCNTCEEYYAHDDGDCPTCPSGLINDYSYRPDPVFYISRNVTRHFDPPANMTFTGFELEMEAVKCSVDSGSELANDIFGDWCYLKYDGSLNNGFEMVSHPLSYKYFIEDFPYEKLTDVMREGMRSSHTRTCGLHIHINKSFFSSHPTTMYRFMSMFYRNAEKWKPIAGRDNSTYATWSEYELERMLDYTKGLKERRRVCNDNRYVALNLQNSHTIELRFFRGTLAPSVFAGRIEAAHAVAHYVHATRNTVSIKSAHEWDRFREWTEANNYKLFNELASSKGV